MDDLTLSLSNGTRLVVPRSLSAITTYVVLEQETWFEKEFPFLKHIVRPGMTAIDIGANLGIYSLELSRLVGPGGRVFAYEPTSATRARLERSRDLNGATNLTVIGAALSDSEREGRILFGGSSELNHLGSEGEGEPVAILTLDAERHRHGWGAPDFIKMDAEGEEEAIVGGAHALLSESSPILMLEIKAEANVNEGLAGAVEELGYRPYRVLPGAPLLVPVDFERVDGYELNMLAVKPDRAAELEARGLLIDAAADFSPTDNDVALALVRLRAQPFASSFAAQFAVEVEIHPAYLRALAAYDVWQRAERSAAQRWGALQYAVRTLTDLVNADARPARLASLARMAAEAGSRMLVAPALQLTVNSVKAGQLQLGEPFWPAHARYDSIPPGDNPGLWFLCAVTQQLEESASLSTMFEAPTETLRWLCGAPFATVGMHRRFWLDRVRHGRTYTPPSVVMTPGPDNLNAELWADGTVAALAPAPASAA